MPQPYSVFAVRKERNMGGFFVVPREEIHPPHLYFIVRTKYIIEILILIDAMLVLHLATPHDWRFLSLWWTVSKEEADGEGWGLGVKQRERERCGGFLGAGFRSQAVSL